MAKAELQAAIATHKLSVKAEFVPWSKSRSATSSGAVKVRDRSLNWRVTLLCGDREILTTDYTAGSAYCPSYKQGQLTVHDQEKIIHETETGLRWHRSTSILPDIEDVIYGLVTDADVLDCATFEEWAEYLGFDPDSRKAEAIYRECLGTALRLRNDLGEAGLAALREAAQDY